MRVARKIQEGMTSVFALMTITGSCPGPGEVGRTGTLPQLTASMQ